MTAAHMMFKNGFALPLVAIKGVVRFSGGINKTMVYDEVKKAMGLHCAAHAHRMLGTLEQGVVRFSPSHFTSDEEIETALQAVRRVAEELS